MWAMLAETPGEQPHSPPYGRGRRGHGEQPHSPLYGCRGSCGFHRGNYEFNRLWRSRGYPRRNPAELQCYECQAMGHISYHCPNMSSGGSDKTSDQATSGGAQVNFCAAVQRMPERVDPVVMSDCAVPIGDSVYDSAWEYGEFPVVEATVKCAPSQGKVKISPLQFVNVMVNGKTVRALNDSGAQIPLISQYLSQEIPTEIICRIVIDGVVGSALVPLTNIGVQLAAEPGIPLM